MPLTWSVCFWSEAVVDHSSLKSNGLLGYENGVGLLSFCLANGDHSVSFTTVSRFSNGEAKRHWTAHGNFFRWTIGAKVFVSAFDLVSPTIEVNVARSYILMG